MKSHPLSFRTTERILDVLCERDSKLESYVGSVGNAIDDALYGPLDASLGNTSVMEESAARALALRAHAGVQPLAAGCSAPASLTRLMLGAVATRFIGKHRLSPLFNCFTRYELGRAALFEPAFLQATSRLNPLIEPEVADVDGLLRSDWGMSLEECIQPASSGLSIQGRYLRRATEIAAAGDDDPSVRGSAWCLCDTFEGDGAEFGGVSVPSGDVVSEPLTGSDLAGIQRGIVPARFSGALMVGGVVHGVNFREDATPLDIVSLADAMLHLESREKRWLMTPATQGNVLIGYFPAETRPLRWTYVD